MKIEKISEDPQAWFDCKVALERFCKKTGQQMPNDFELEHVIKQLILMACIIGNYTKFLNELDNLTELSKNNPRYKNINDIFENYLKIKQRLRDIEKQVELEERLKRNSINE